MGDHLATIDTGRKVGGCCDPFRDRGGAGSTSNTMWPGSTPTSIPSGILIHPTVWPQYTNVTDRQSGHTMVRQHRRNKNKSRDPDHARWVNRSSNPKRHLDRFSRFSKLAAECRYSVC